MDRDIASRPWQISNGNSDDIRKISWQISKGNHGKSTRQVLARRCYLRVHVELQLPFNTETSISAAIYVQVLVHSEPVAVTRSSCVLYIPSNFATAAPPAFVLMRL